MEGIRKTDSLIPPDNRTKIKMRLAGMEAQEGVRVLYACESGSRAWGFPSTDSDYDVRFIYAHPVEWYLSVQTRRDVIERPQDNLIDLSGWDVQKALDLLRKSNPPLLEWLQSPIIYHETPDFIRKMTALLPSYYSPRNCLHHYAYDWAYNGFTDLPKHFFPQIGNLRAEGEEFDCAVFLATQLEGIKYWVRNVERKPTAFSLQTATDRFYPDFVCRLEDGRNLVVEYKNTKDWDLPDNQEKRQLGELWERRSDGKGLFIMPRGKDWMAIRKKSKA